MRDTYTEISEHDVVALLCPVDGWPIGTEGTVLNKRRAVKFIEISNHRGEAVDFLDVPTEALRLTWKCRPSIHGARAEKGER